MKLLGVKLLVVSNAVGGLNSTYNVGDIMLVKDHINMFGLSGESPLRGPNDESFGPRFFSVNNLYDARWREAAMEAAERVGGRAVLVPPLIRSFTQVGISSTLHQGILTMSGGPNYESVAELKMFSMMGVDCVGMSSIPECLTAHHCGSIISHLIDKLVTSS